MRLYENTWHVKSAKWILFPFSLTLDLGEAGNSDRSQVTAATDLWAFILDKCKEPILGFWKSSKSFSVLVTL